ncbi:somatostatin receptor type 2-like [Clavelina lepadiformis]|uniref:somatostatin receptor type 2-like n=1 Tax=Clavelina lepadiformis TaxID=159417 RepID=UPI0040437E7C
MHESFVAPGVLLYVIMAIGLVGNSVVLWVLIRQRKTWCVPTIYLFNLAAADTLFLLSIPFMAQAMLNQMHWNFGSPMCTFFLYWGILNMNASIYFLTGMSIDRWVAVAHPIKFAHVRTHKTAKLGCLGIWLLAAILSLPNAIFAETKELKDTNIFEGIFAEPNKSDVSLNQSWGKNTEGFYSYCDYHGVSKYPNKFTVLGALSFLQFFTGFLVPTCIIGICYVKIVTAVKNNIISKRVRKDKVAKLSCCIVSAFFICWLPMQALNFYTSIAFWADVSLLQNRIYQEFFPYAYCLAWSHSCFNPIAYAFITTNFQLKARDTFSKRRPSDFSSRNSSISLPARESKRVTNSVKLSTLKANAERRGGYTRASCHSVNHYI